MTMKSYTSLSSPSSRSIWPEPSSSEGLGGRSPAGKMRKLGINPEGCTAFSTLHRPASRLERPGFTLISSFLATLGRRISASISSTSRPVSAMV